MTYSVFGINQYGTRFLSCYKVGVQIVMECTNAADARIDPKSIHSKNVMHHELAIT